MNDEFKTDTQRLIEAIRERTAVERQRNELLKAMINILDERL